MDWLESEELVVVTDEDFLDMFQSPDSCTPWGLSNSDSFGSHNMSIEENDQEVMFEEQVEVSFQSEQSISSTVVPEFQFNDYLSRDDMDDFFLGSNLGLGMLETENNNDTSYHLSSEPQLSLIPSVDGGIPNLIFDWQSNVSNNLVEKAYQCSFHGISKHCESNGSSWCNGGQILPEECLFELGMVMKWLPDSTRLCFRDYFYRHSYNSIQYTPILQADDERIRSSSEETDIIDRVVETCMCSY